MRKFIGIAMCIALLSFVNVAFAGTVSIEEEFDASVETYVGEAIQLNIEGQDLTLDGSRVTILANGHKDGVTTHASTASGLTAASLAYGVIKLQGVGAPKTISLAAGTAGQMVTITLDSIGAAITISDDGLGGSGQAAVVETGWDDIAFDSILDTVTLLYADDTTGWIIIGQTGVTVT